MIAVVIVAILAAVAMPSYSDYVRRGNRASAQGYMMGLAAREAQFLVENRAYAATVAALSSPIPSDVNKYYTIAIATGATPPSFTITATPKSNQTSDTCGTLTLADTGAKTPSTGGCW